jgi:hypothetical protein
MNKNFDDWLQQQLGLKTATPTYPASDSVPVEDARLKVDEAFEAYLVEEEAWNEENAPGEDEEDDPFANFAEEHSENETPPPPVHAADIPTGIGKTQRVIARLARCTLYQGAH